MLYRMLVQHRSPRTLSTTTSPQRETPLRPISVRNLTPIYGLKTPNAHVVVKQPKRFYNLDASPCSTTVSTCGIAHGVLLSLAGHQSARLSPQEPDDAFDIILPTKLLGPRMIRLNQSSGVGVHAMTSSFGKNNLEPRPSQTSWSGHADAIN
jgi:hypothetical protein